MKAHRPSHIHREDMLRRAWWLHFILVVGVWGWNVVVGGLVEFCSPSQIGKSKPESPDKRACNTARVKFPTWAAAWRREPRRPAERLSLSFGICFQSSISGSRLLALASDL